MVNSNYTYPYKCGCSDIIPNYQLMPTHINNNCTLNYPECTVCSKKFILQKSVETHHLKFHVHLENKQLNDKYKKYSCGTCSKLSYSFREYVLHNNTHCSH